jgi:hypothetical protein
VADNASASERYAAQTLVRYLNNISKSHFELQNATAATAAQPQLAVGFGAACALGVPATVMAGLGEEGFVVSSVHKGLTSAQAVLTGGEGAPRGTIYAVDACLEALGAKFLAWDVTVLPSSLPPNLPGWDMRELPAMQMRQAYNWETQVAADFDTHARLNKAVPHSDSWLPEILDQAHGSSVYYATPPGFTATIMSALSNGTVGGSPPPDLWRTHREWFWPRGDAYGPGSTCSGHNSCTQVCWSNSSLQQFLLERAKDFLRRDPGARLISFSQLDNSNYCQSPTEAAIIAEEQSPAGPMLRAVNFIAQGLEADFPDVMVDTLAYSYTQKAPLITRPRQNVVIRLCTSSFDKEMIESWSNLTKHIFVWDYLTVFGAYLEPFPITLQLPADIRFLARNGVTGCTSPLHIPLARTTVGLDLPHSLRCCCPLRVVTVFTVFLFLVGARLWRDGSVWTRWRHVGAERLSAVKVALEPGCRHRCRHRIISSRLLWSECGDVCDGVPELAAWRGSVTGLLRTLSSLD